MASGDARQATINHMPQNPSCLIRKLVNLMDHPISKSATERHLHLLKNFIMSSQYAFWLPDIPYIIKLYEIIVKKLDAIPQFKRPLECLLHFTAVPPMMTKASDVLNYSRDLQEYFSILGYLILCLHSNDLKKLVLNAIKGMLKFEPSPEWNYFTPQQTLKEAVEKSRLPEVLAQLLPIVNNVTYPLLLDVMFTVCQISTATCVKMLTEEPLEYLLCRLEPKWLERNSEDKPERPTAQDTIPYLEDTCCILWKLLNAVNENIVLREPSKNALWSLQYAFQWTNISSLQKINRNNLLAIIVKILVTFPDMNFYASDLSRDLLMLAVAAAGCGRVSNLQFSENKLDFQFRKIIWSCLHFYSREKNYKNINGTDLVKAFIKNLFQRQLKTKNQMEQYCDLVKIILKILPKFLITSEEVFMNFNGPIKIIKMIESYLTKPYELEILEAYIYCLSECLMLGIENITFLFGEHNTANIIICICNKILEDTCFTATHQKILGRGFCTLQILDTAGYIKNTEIIKLCIHFLQRLIRPLDNDTLIDMRLTICAIHLLWECILTSKLLFRDFLKGGGIYVMLDVAEISTFYVKSLALGVLADIALKPNCIPFLITWRKHGQNLIPMLLQIFRNKTEKECEKITELSENKPKNTWLQLCQTQKTCFQVDCVLKTNILEMCRTRIHGILHSVKIRYKDRVKAANEFYKIFNIKLKTDDELTMLFAENFASLRLCQMWLDIAKELNREGITPIDDDDKLIQEKLEGVRQWKTYLQSTIDNIVLKEEQREKRNEMRSYMSLKDARLSNALDALKELTYIANGTERMFQMRKQILLQRELDQIRIRNTHFHRTMGSLRFLKICNQNINIQSNIIYEKKEEQRPVTPVSLGEETYITSPSIEHPLSEHKPTC